VGIIIVFIIIIIIIITPYSALLDIGLSNFSPSRLISGYSHPAPASPRKSSLHLA
jgi:hypothetical protein